MAGGKWGGVGRSESGETRLLPKLSVWVPKKAVTLNGKVGRRARLRGKR